MISSVFICNYASWNFTILHPTSCKTQFLCLNFPLFFPYKDWQSYLCKANYTVGENLFKENRSNLIEKRLEGKWQPKTSEEVSAQVERLG